MAVRLHSRSAAGAPGASSAQRRMQRSRSLLSESHWDAETRQCDRSRGSATRAATSGAAAARLRDWVVKHSGPQPTPLLPADSGVGMRAQQAVEGGQMLALVNRKLLITATSAAESPVYGKMIKEAGLTEWQALTLALLAERALGPRSFWAPYLEVLPDQAAHPLLWDEAQAAAWLAGSPMLRVLQARRQQILDDCEALQVAGANELPAVAGCWAERGHLYPAATGGGSDELVTVASVTWAAATLLSRGISLDLALEEDPIEGDMGSFGSWQAAQPDELALVPWADMFRHSPDAGPQAIAHYSTRLGGVTLAAHRRYAPGEEVFDSCGPNLSAVDMLLDYGVCNLAAAAAAAQAPVPPGAAAAAEAAAALAAAAARAAAGGLVEEAEEPPAGGQPDRVDLPVDLLAPPRGARNRALLAALAAATGQASSLAVGPEGPDMTAMAFLRAGLATDAELVRAGWRVKASDKDAQLALKVMGSLSEPLSPTTEAAVLRSLLAALESQMGAYPSSIEQDQAALEALDALDDKLAAAVAAAAAAAAPSPSSTAPAATTASAATTTTTVTHLRRSALAALMSEKRALLGAAAVVRTWAGRLQQNPSMDMTDVYAELYDGWGGDGVWEGVDDEGGAGWGGDSSDVITPSSSAPSGGDRGSRR